MPLNSAGIDNCTVEGYRSWLGGLDAEEIVDRGGNALGGGEVGVAQAQARTLGRRLMRELDLALDDGAVGDAADGRYYAADDAGGGAFGREAGNRHRALCNRR